MNPAAMKHTTPILALALLVAASASAQVASSKAKTSALNYDRISVGYSQNDVIKSYEAGFTASLGEYLIVGGSYSDINSRGLPVNIDGKGNSVGLGLKFPVGPGDLIVSYSYGQVQLGGAVGTDVYLAAADGAVYGLNYRAAINSTVEINVGVSRNNVAGVILGYDLTPPATVTTDVLFEKSTDYGLSLRFNVTKQFDITAGFSRTNSSNGWSLSAGLSF